MTHPGWHTALRGIKNDRADRPEIRMERLRTSAHLRAPGSLYSANWRGRSKKRYIFSVFSTRADENLNSTEFGGGVFVAIKFGADGQPEIISTRAYEAEDGRFAFWLEAAVDHGATEIHVHRLTQDQDERLAIAADLRNVPARVAAPAVAA